MAESQDQEITLGTGRLLGLFFGLVMLCAIFFSLGYSLGRGSGRAEAASPVNILPTAAAVGSPTAPKPTATHAGAKADCPDPANCPQQASTSDELTFYKSVGQDQPKAQLEPAAAPKPETTVASAAAVPAPEKQLAPEMAKSAAPVQGGYMVQVAAVSKQEDADALVAALQKKQYPVFTVNSGDKLFHVQVGPFADIKDADAMKTKLAGDGYNAIVKK